MSAHHQDRLDRARARLTELDVDALLAGPSSDLFWLTGYRAMPLERLTLLVLPAEGGPRLLVPELEEPRAGASGAGDLAEIVSWKEDERPIGHAVDLLARAGCPLDGRFAVQDQLWSSFLLRLQGALTEASWIEGSAVTRDLRLLKAPDELDALRAAGAAIDRVHATVPELLRPGRTEREIGRDIAERIAAEHDESAFVIVASGPNGASPHHETGDRVVEEGDAVVVDIGGIRGGYCSDMTRNYVVGTVPDGYREIHDAVAAAQRAGVAAVRPGVTAEEVDAAARRVIAGAGYGELFVHRTGHGIGVDVHEAPYLVAGSTEPLQAGMAFSVEPGIYVPGRYGARIEDIVIVTEDGAERVNTLGRELVEVAV
ncbi:MAG: M24 family metallopeptidase [Nitriliruptorales bacterium]